MERSNFRILTAGAVAAFLACTAQAQTISFEVGNAFRSRLGAEINSQYDNFTFTGMSNAALDVTNPVSGVEVGQMSFEVGVNCTTCKLTPTYTESIDFAVNGMVQQFGLTYTWSSTGPVDTITFATPGPLTFDLGGKNVTVTFDTPGALSGGLTSWPSSTYTGSLRATFVDPPSEGPVAPVPEPSTYALMLAGLGFVGAIARRRRSAS
jgi:hypothetical protein